MLYQGQLNIIFEIGTPRTTAYTAYEPGFVIHFGLELTMSKPFGLVSLSMFGDILLYLLNI